MGSEIVTIDGPTSSGKNSVGFLLAKKLGYQYIDSGSIYRAGCLLLLRNKIPVNDLGKILEVFENLQIEVKVKNGQQRFFANGEDITDRLHDPAVTKIVPLVAAIKEVREATKQIQQKLASSKKIVMTGRDIGSEIFPRAKHKFFLTATPEVRAQRRYAQLKQIDPTISLEQVLKDMIDRDHKDSTREISPMRVPEGAVVIDNTQLSVEQTVDKMLKHIERKRYA